MLKFSTVKMIKRNSFFDLKAPVILQSKWYNDSTKKLSFSYQNEGDEENIFAYIALKNEDCKLPELKGKHGCKILGYDFKNDISPCQQDQLYEEALDKMKNYVIKKNYTFDYCWFETGDFNFTDIAIFLRENCRNVGCTENILYYVF